ncbi:DUF7562 family protein [Haladaptatus sp. CMSO5]|uniref:DUF7562 family protein n=1 Tax=Haladaptatus sp. CMSO5 TaxID=3120514 RepID=UPI002FCE0114
MWGSRKSRASTVVTCTACGKTVLRNEAREYDKYGNRWDRDGKQFEHLCKKCDTDLCHQPRGGLETLLTECGAGEVSQDEFLARYTRTVRDRYDSLGER